LRILIIQNQLPPYRDFLWDGLKKNFDLFLAESDSDTLILDDGSITSFRNYKFDFYFDCLIINGGIREIKKAIFYKIKYRAKKVFAWTQFVGKNKSLVSRLIKSIYLKIFFDHTLLYYEHEKNLIPFKFLKKHCSGLNNTITDWAYLPPVNKIKNSFLFIGRNTHKANLSLLLEAALKVNDITVHLIGVNADEILTKYHVDRFIFYGEILDHELIENLAKDSAYFVYPGDVGLSIVHAVKLGLVPLVHSKMPDHMPECRAVCESFPVITFEKGNCESLSNFLNILSTSLPSASLKTAIAKQARQIFSQDVMVLNFVNALKGN
jgi:glycosyltransferase involved in cell wall biosynthesis